MSSSDTHPAATPTAPSHRPPKRVGDFALNVAANELMAPDGGVTRVEPRVMALLVRLACAPGEVVSRETLIDEVWSRRMVNDEVLSRAIADLRSALGDDSRTPRYIETIPKSGYRLIAKVETDVIQTGAEDAVPSLTPKRRSTHWPVWVAGGLATVMVATAALIVNLKQKPGKHDTAAWEQALESALREAKPLTASPGLELSPRLSPDGKRVLYVLLEERRAELMLHDPALPAPKRVSETGEDVSSGVFMPDGRGLVYRALVGTGCTLRQVTAEITREISACVRNEPPRIDLSPDGKWLVRSRSHRESYPAGLALLDMQTGTTRQLTTPDVAEGEDALPRFSPDGTQIAFVRGNSSARTIHILNIASGESRKLSPLSGLTYGLAWVPDGKALLVAADWFGFRALNWLDVRDGKARLLGARGARAPDVAGGRVVYENAIFQANLFRIPVGLIRDAKVEPMHVSTRYTSQPSYSPDGAKLAFVSNREGVESIYISIAGAAAQKLVLPDTHRYMRPTWSADGNSVYAIRVEVAADRSGPQQGIRVDVATGKTIVLPLGDNIGSISESRDGRWLYVGERDGRLMRLWRAPLDAAGMPGKQERLPISLAGEFQLSRDRIAFTQAGLQGITVCSQDGQSCELKRVPAGDRHDDHWALTDRGLYFVERVGNTRSLKRHDLKGGVVTTVSNSVPTTLGGGLAVHPQETEIIIAREQQPSIDLMTGAVIQLK